MILYIIIVILLLLNLGVSLKTMTDTTTKLTKKFLTGGSVRDVISSVVGKGEPTEEEPATESYRYRY